MPVDSDNSGTRPPGDAGPRSGRPSANVGDVHELVHDIRSYLEQSTAREAELLRREQEVERRLAKLALHAATAGGVDAVDTDTAVAFAGPRAHTANRWRVAIVAVIVSATVGLAWFIARPTPCRATARIHVVTAADPPAAAVAAHRAALLDPDLLRGDPNAAGLAPLWLAACHDGRVAAWTTADQPELQLSVILPHRDDAQRLLRAAVAAYGRRVEQSWNTPRPTVYDDLAARRASLQSELAAVDQQRTDDAALLANTPAVIEAEQLGAAAEGLEGELARIAAALDDARSELAVSIGTDAPRGAVAPTEIAAALADDVVYQEDHKELLAVATQYRTELAVALYGVTEPARTVATKLAAFDAAVVEQNALEPPAEIRAVLDACTTSVAPLQSRIAPFTVEWQGRLEAAQNLSVPDNTLELVKMQTAAADTAERLADEATALAGDLGTQAEALNSAGGGGTRAVVVAALLRSEHGTLKTSVETLAAAARRTTLGGNIELDTLDRRLRGLHVRLAGREETVGQRLQLDADRTVQTGHVAHVDELRQQARELERRREDVVAKLMGTIQRLRGLDDAVRQRAQVEARVQQRAAEVQWLSERLERVEQELATLLAQRAEPDRFFLAEPTFTTVGLPRLVAALVAALVAFATTWIISGVLGGPWPHAVSQAP
jgi:hypothetical protein